MEYLLPQEIQVRYVLPAIRGELTKALVNDHKLPQKEVARLLRMTEAAISQYLNNRRGNNIKLGNELIEEIRKSASSIKHDNSLLTQELLRLSQLDSAIKATCIVHLANDPSVTKECRICFEKR